MNKATFTIAIIGTAAMARNLSSHKQQVEDEFEFLQFASVHNKHYATANELKMRAQNWEANRAEVDEMNQRAGGRATFTVNQFSDMTGYEKEQYLGLPGHLPSHADCTVEDFTDGSETPRGKPLTETNISWTEHMTPVKNQGGCGSCSCFSATSALEGVQSIKSTEDSGNFTPAVRLSEQQGLDCTSTGCRTGGWMQWYFDFARENGANTNEQYPYQAVDGEECLNDPSTAPTFVQDVFTVASAWNKPEEATVENIRAALEEGPLTFAMSAGHNLFFQYSSGVIDATMGCPESMDHAMVIVGYEVVGGEVTQEESYDHCEIIRKEKIKNKRRCRRPTKEERESEVCETSEDGQDFYGWINKRDKFKCCYDEEIIKVKEKIDPKCEPIIIETVTDGMPVWVIQNSWGTGWGDSGFARIEATDGNGVCYMNYWTQAVTAQ